MKVLYSKSSMDRRKKFQIWTSIVEYEEKKYVIKKPVYQEGIIHIKNICSNGEALKSVNKDLTDSSFYENGRAIAPYLEGISLGKKLSMCFDDNAKMKMLLSEWRRIIEGSETNLCDFVMTQEFEDILGDAAELTGDRSVRISNLDCSGDNVIYLPDNHIRVIDHEWVFRFPAPTDFLFYRVLKLFYEYNRGHTDWNVLLELSGINGEKTDIYERLTQTFNNYVTKEKESGIDYSIIGRKFKESKVIDKNQRAVFSYRFPYKIIPQDCRLVLYGAGRVGADYYNLIKATKYCRLALWVDQQAAYYKKQGLDVSDSSRLNEALYDYILIAVMSENVADEIRYELMQAGIEKDKILWARPEVI